jgi:hypothetical protein
MVQHWNLTRVAAYFAAKHRDELQRAAAQYVYENSVLPAMRRARKEAMLEERVRNARRAQATTHFQNSIFTRKSHLQDRSEVRPNSDAAADVFNFRRIVMCHFFKATAIRLGNYFKRHTHAYQLLI